MAPTLKEESPCNDNKIKCTFYDLKHSNNSARVRLWLRIHGSLSEHVETVMLVHDDMDDGGKLAAVNPLRKVPAFVVKDSGLKLYESYVILSYLEDKFGGQPDAPKLVMDTPEDRAFVQLLVRIHDIYISSPNCTQPHFSHTQGCMYLDPIPTQYTPERRTMPDPVIRASKLKEIYERLNWLEITIRSPFMAGERISHADITWFPTCVFMEVLLPYVFDWSPVFHEYEKFPRLSRWFEMCTKNEHFASVRDDIYNVLIQQKKDGRFDGVRGVVSCNPDFQWKYM
ncbi:hypothetical protein HJC23_002424 [Cyclotella cryptica]|uniref:Glutathione S-transferase n=1 Tax=Cyclotella cryptica TaxID=29204 RepID=A0ABD3PV95_9STRA